MCVKGCERERDRERQSEKGRSGRVGEALSYLEQEISLSKLSCCI